MSARVSAMGSLRPVPGRSTMRHRNPSRCSTRGAHVDPAFGPPWTNSTGGPSPTSCTRTSTFHGARVTRRSLGCAPTDSHSVRSASRNRASFTPGRYSRVSLPVSGVVVVPAETLGPPRLVAVVDRAGPDPLGAVLPVVEEISAPRLVLDALVRRRQVLIHERHDDLDEIAQLVNHVGRLVVVVRLSAR